MWAKKCVEWLTQNGAWFFDQLSALLSKVINALLFLLQWPHALVIVALMTGLSFYLRRSIGLALFTCLGLLLIINQGYWKENDRNARAGSSCHSRQYGDRHSAWNCCRAQAMALRIHASDPRSDADHSHLRLFDPRLILFGSEWCPG